jgi:hypothetical protein
MIPVKPAVYRFGWHILRREPAQSHEAKPELRQKARNVVCLEDLRKGLNPLRGDPVSQLFRYFASLSLNVHE